MMLDESKYHQLIDVLQQQVEDRLERVDFEVDIDSANGLLTLEFESGNQIIFSRQPALYQLWVAAKSGGYHLAYNSANESWQVVGTNQSINELLQRLVLEQTGEVVDFSELL